MLEISSINAVWETSSPIYIIVKFTYNNIYFCQMNQLILHFIMINHNYKVHFLIDMIDNIAQASILFLIFYLIVKM